MNRQKYCIFAFLFFLLSFNALSMQIPQQNLMLIGGSRSATTVIFQYFLKENEEATGLNEPSCPIIFKEQAEILYNGTQFSNFAALKDFYENARNPLIVKEISYGAQAFFKAEPSALNSFDRFIFLVANPYAQVISLYEKVKYSFDEIKGFSSLIGQQALYEMLLELKDELKHKKVVLVEADKLCSHPEDILSKVHERLGMNFNRSSLRWPAGPIGERLVEYKLPHIAAHWHGKIDESTGFLPLRSRPTVEGEPDFKEIENEAHRAVVKDAYRENLEFYQKTSVEFADLLVVIEN